MKILLQEKEYCSIIMNTLYHSEDPVTENE